MAEILGILASAAQLTQYLLKICAAVSAVHNRVRGAPELRKHVGQLEQLVDTIAIIQHNPQIHTFSILQHLEIVDQEADRLLLLLEKILKKYTSGSIGKRYLKAIIGSDEEKKVETSFKRLEQEKVSLIFCISIANSEKLETINSGVSELVEGMASSQVKVAYREPTPVYQVPSSSRSKQSLSRTASKGELVRVERVRAPTSDSMSSSTKQENPAAGGTYEAENCCVIGDTNTAIQINGVLGTVPETFKYKGNTVTGNGMQINGGASGNEAIALLNLLASQVAKKG